MLGAFSASFLYFFVGIIFAILSIFGILIRFFNNMFKTMVKNAIDAEIENITTNFKEELHEFKSELKYDLAEKAPSIKYLLSDLMIRINRIT